MPDYDEQSTLVDDTGSGDSPVSTSVRKAPRVALACSRCKRRKQRCDGLHPKCTSCTRASTECIYERTVRPRYPGGKSLYISALEERIAFLEARLPEHGRDHFVSPDSEPLLAKREIQSQSPRHDPPRRASYVSVDSLGADDEEQSSLVDGVAYLSLCASGATDTAPEPFYVGSSSGATIARLIQSSIFKTTKAPDENASSERHRPSVLRPSNTDHVMDDGPPLRADERRPVAEFPPATQARTLFTVFFERLHVRWPILDRRLFGSVFEKQWDDGALSPVERSILHLIYAISARFLQLMKRKGDVDPERHFAAAIAPMDYILEQHNLATVQFLAMLAIYGSRSPYGAGSWSQVRYAMTLCIELGLHRRQSTQAHEDLEIRRRVFWACYCLDRMTTTTLGRTFAIADRDINAELPSESPDYWYLTAESPGDAHWPNVSLFAHVIRLRQLQSLVFRTVWRVDKNVLGTEESEGRKKLDRKIQDIKLRLDAWLVKLPLPTEDVNDRLWMYDPELVCHDSHEYFQLQYHKTVLSLYTALLPVLPVSDDRFLCATQSAAAVCQTYKSLNAHKTLSYTITALHSCFIAGLTLVYCLWRDPDLFDYDALDATRACSLCLTIFGEKWPGAVKYRDIFDAMSGSLLKTIVGKGAQRRQDGDLRPSLDMSSTLPQQSSMPPIPEAAPSAPMPGTTYDDAAVEGQHGNAIYGAVKDAFMEVDDGSQGGWEGWRMFTELIQSDMAMAPSAMDIGATSKLPSSPWGPSGQWQWNSGL